MGKTYQVVAYFSQPKLVSSLINRFHQKSVRFDLSP